MKEKVGTPRKIDQLGRICIPIEFRKICNMHPFDEVEISVCGKKIEIRKFEPQYEDWIELLKDILETVSEKTDTQLFLLISDIIMTSGIKDEEERWHDFARKIISDSKDFMANYELDDAQSFLMNGIRFYLLQIDENMRLLIPFKSTMSEQNKTIFNVCLTLMRNIIMRCTNTQNPLPITAT